MQPCIKRGDTLFESKHMDKLIKQGKNKSKDKKQQTKIIN